MPDPNGAYSEDEWGNKLYDSGVLAGRNSDAVGTWQQNNGQMSYKYNTPMGKAIGDTYNVPGGRVYGGGGGGGAAPVTPRPTGGGGSSPYLSMLSSSMSSGPSMNIGGFDLGNMLRYQMQNQMNQQRQSQIDYERAQGAAAMAVRNQPHFGASSYASDPYASLQYMQRLGYPGGGNSGGGSGGSGGGGFGMGDIMSLYKTQMEIQLQRELQQQQLAEAEKNRGLSLEMQRRGFLNDDYGREQNSYLGYGIS